MAEPNVIVTGLAPADAAQSAGTFFQAFVDGMEVIDLSALPAAVAFDLMFDDDSEG